MKKFLLAIAILFSFATQAQDTSYIMKRDKFYMILRQEVNTPSAKEACIAAQMKKDRRKSRTFTIVSLALFGAISTWYWSR